MDRMYGANVLLIHVCAYDCHAYMCSGWAYVLC